MPDGGAAGARCSVPARAGREKHPRAKGAFVSERPGNRARLDEVGFVWDSHQHTFETVVVPALEWYGREHDGGMNVPLLYVMFETECRAAGLPAHVSEYRVGRAMDRIRFRGNFVSERPGNRARLEEMGDFEEYAPQDNERAFI